MTLLSGHARRTGYLGHINVTLTHGISPGPPTPLYKVHFVFSFPYNSSVSRIYPSVLIPFCPIGDAVFPFLTCESGCCVFRAPLPVPRSVLDNPVMPVGERGGPLPLTDEAVVVRHVRAHQLSSTALLCRDLLDNSPGASSSLQEGIKVVSVFRAGKRCTEHIQIHAHLIFTML